MDGVMNMKREFSSDYNDMDTLWKYEVEYFEDGTLIKYMEYENGKWLIKDTININSCCDELLFSTLARDFKNGEVREIRG